MTDQAPEQAERPEISTDQVFTKDPDVVNRIIAGEPILVPIRGQLADMETIFAMNQIGQFVWDQLDGEKSVETVICLVLENFETERETAEKDVKAFLADLSGQGIILPA